MKNDKNVKIIICIICFILISGLILLVSKKNDLNANNKNIIGELDANKTSYGYPFIKWTYCDNLVVTIESGIYRFGDISKDGLIGYSDLETLKQMVTVGGYGFNKDDIILADVNEDKRVDNKDIELFKDYLKKNKEVEYDTNKELLLYCLNDINDSSNCNWQKESSFKVEESKDYYAFVKHKNNERISNSVLVSKNIIK